MILLLLHSYEENKKLFDNPDVHPNKCWSIVVKCMQKNGYSQCDVEKCRKKFSYLDQCYEKCIEHNTTSGNDRQEFAYFNEFQRIFHQDPKYKPVSTIHSICSDSDEEEKTLKLDTGRKREKKKNLTNNEIFNELVEETRKARSRKANLDARKEARAEKKLELGVQMVNLLAKMVEKNNNGQ